LQRYKILFISGNYSRILTRLDRRFTSLEMRRAFTSFQLMTILEENHHRLPDRGARPLFCEDAKQMVEYVGQALKQTSREATILLFAPALDPHLQTITELADRVFCIYEGEKAPVKGRGKDARRPGHFGGLLMRWPWKRRAQLIDPGIPSNLRVIELQTAKEILAEVFHARPGEVEEMIQMRLLGRAGGARGRAVAGDVLLGE
jgi:hypothetical protein